MTQLSITFAMLFSVSCYSSVLENAEFPTRLKACRSLEACQIVEAQARRSLGECSDNTTIYMLADGPKRLSCIDARENLQNAETKIARLKTVQLEHQRAEQQQHDDLRLAEQERQDDLRLAEHEARMGEQQMHERDQEQQRRSAEKDIRTEQANRQIAVLETCESTKGARATRRRHADILQNHDPATFVRKHCVQQRQMNAVQIQCTDGNGFVRTCMKQVAGDVVGFLCPKNVETDVAKLGLFQLGVTDDPFPEDQGIPVSDDDCDKAAKRLIELQARIDAAEPRARPGTLDATNGDRHLQDLLNTLNASDAGAPP